MRHTIAIIVAIMLVSAAATTKADPPIRTYECKVHLSGYYILGRYEGHSEMEAASHAQKRYPHGSVIWCVPRKY